MSGMRTDVGAGCNLAASFLADLLRTLKDEDAMWVRVKLGAEHLEQLKFALNSLKALQEIVGIPMGGQPVSGCDAFDATDEPF